MFTSKKRQMTFTLKEIEYFKKCITQKIEENSTLTIYKTFPLQHNLLLTHTSIASSVCDIIITYLNETFVFKFFCSSYGFSLIKNEDERFVFWIKKLTHISLSDPKQIFMKSPNNRILLSDEYDLLKENYEIRTSIECNDDITIIIKDIEAYNDWLSICTLFVKIIDDIL